jgi:hypothetical protein
MNEEQIQDSEDQAVPAPVHREVMRILESGFERSDPSVGDQIVNTQWMVPKWGCDSLQHVADEVGERLSEVKAVLALLDQLAEQWGDEGVFRRCRDRLRAIVSA